MPGGKGLDRTQKRIGLPHIGFLGFRNVGIRAPHTAPSHPLSVWTANRPAPLRFRRRRACTTAHTPASLSGTVSYFPPLRSRFSPEAHSTSRFFRISVFKTLFFHFRHLQNYNNIFPRANQENSSLKKVSSPLLPGYPCYEGRRLGGYQFRSGTDYTASYGKGNLRVPNEL